MRSRVLEPSPIGLIGGVLAVISCFLAWGGYDDSFDVPLQFLWDKDATGGVKLGIPLVSVAGAVALFSLSAVEPFVFLRRLGGVVLLGATALFVVQLSRRIGWDNLSAGNIDVAPYLGGAGGLLALLSALGRVATGVHIAVVSYEISLPWKITMRHCQFIKKCDLD